MAGARSWALSVPFLLVVLSCFLVVHPAQSTLHPRQLLILDGGRGGGHSVQWLRGQILLGAGVLQLRGGELSPRSRSSSRWRDDAGDDEGFLSCEDGEGDASEGSGCREDGSGEGGDEDDGEYGNAWSDPIGSDEEVPLEDPRFARGIAARGKRQQVKEEGKEEGVEGDDGRDEELVQGTTKATGGLNFGGGLTGLDSYLAELDDEADQKAEAFEFEKRREDAGWAKEEEDSVGLDPQNSEELDKVFEQARDFAEQTLWVGFPSPLPTIRSGLDMVRLNHNDTLLDLGCGDGRVCMIAAQEYGAAAFGVDVDEISLGYAEQMLELAQCSAPVNFTVGDAVVHPFGNATVLYIFLPPELIAQDTELFQRVVDFLLAGGRCVSIALPLDLLPPAAADTKAAMKVYVYDAGSCERVPDLVDPDEVAEVERMKRHARETINLRDPEEEGEIPEMDGDDRNSAGGVVNLVRGDAARIVEQKMRKSWRFEAS